MLQHFKTKLKIPRKSHYKKEEEAEKAFKKLPNTLNNIRSSLNKNICQEVNLYYSGRSQVWDDKPYREILDSLWRKTNGDLPACFKTTYLYGSYSLINGNNSVWEINGVSAKIFGEYLRAFPCKNQKNIRPLQNLLEIGFLFEN